MLALVLIQAQPPVAALFAHLALAAPGIALAAVGVVVPALAQRRRSMPRNKALQPKA
jgi:hypothetical protein